MIKITFKHSRSQKINEILKLAEKFENFNSDTEVYILDVNLKEVFEKWEWFNSIYWQTIRWVGTSIEYDGMTYYSYRDQTIIFYSLQQSKWNHINIVSFKLVQMYRRYEGKDLYDVKLQGIADDMMDKFLDQINKKPN